MTLAPGGRLRVPFDSPPPGFLTDSARARPQDPVESEIGNLMDTAFQLAGDIALFDTKRRTACRLEQTAARVALAFGDACARSRDRPHDRVVVVAVDPFLIEEMQNFLAGSDLPAGVAHVVDVRTVLPRPAFPPPDPSEPSEPSEPPGPPVPPNASGLSGPFGALAALTQPRPQSS